MGKIGADSNFPGELEYVRDLEWFDGPLLVEYRTHRGTPYIGSWVDCDQNVNRWLLFQTSTDLLESYLENRISLLDLIKTNPRPPQQDGRDVYLRDINADSAVECTRYLKFSELPEDYLPGADCFYSS